MAGARKEEVSGAMTSILKKMEVLIDNTNQVYQDQVSILSSIETVQSNVVAIELKKQTEILTKLSSQLMAKDAGVSTDKGKTKEFSESFGSISKSIKQLIKVAQKMDASTADKLETFFVKLSNALNNFTKQVDPNKVKALNDILTTITKKVFFYAITMILVTPLLILSLPGALAFGISIKLLLLGIGFTAGMKTKALQNILSLSGNILLYTLAMVAVTVLSPIVIIGSILFGISIKLLLKSLGTLSIKQIAAMSQVLSLAKGVLLYSLAMVVASVLSPIVLVGSVLFGLSIRLLLLTLGTVSFKQILAMYLVLKLAKGILLFSLAMVLFTLISPIVLIGSIIFGFALMLISFGLRQMGSKKVLLGVLSLYLVSLSILLLGLSIMMFTKMVQWEDMLKVGVAIAGLGLMMFVLGQFSNIIAKGALVSILIGISLMIFSIGFAIFASAVQKVTWEHLGMMGAVIGVMALIGTVLGVPPIVGFAAAGAGVLILLGAAFVVFSTGFLIFATAISMLDKDDPKIMGEVFYEIAKGMGIIGLASPLISVGAAALGVAAAALIPLSLSLAIFKGSGFKKKDADNLSYALQSVVDGFLGGKMPGGIVAGIKFAAAAAARAALLAVTAGPMLLAGAALIPITKSLKTFKEAKFGKEDADNLEYLLASVVKSFGIVTDFKRQKKMGFYTDPVSLMLGISSLSGAGRVLAGLADGVKAWANLEVNEWEVVGAGTKDAKLVIKNRRKLNKADFDNAAHGMAQVISAIAGPLAQVGRLESGLDPEGNTSVGKILGNYFGSGGNNYVSKGIKALNGIGSLVVGLADGVKAFSTMEFTSYEVVGAGTPDAKLVPKERRPLSDEEIKKAGENIGVVIGLVAKEISKVGEDEVKSSGVFTKGYLSKGVKALAGIGETVKNIADAVLGFATATFTPMKLDDKGQLVPAGSPVKLSDTDLKSAAKTLGSVINLIGEKLYDFGAYISKNRKFIDISVKYLPGMAESITATATSIEAWQKLTNLEDTAKKMSAFFEGIYKIFDPKQKPQINHISFYFSKFTTNIDSLSKNATHLERVAASFEKIGKSTEVIKKNVNDFDLKKLTLTDSMFKSMAILSKNPEAVAKAVASSMEEAFEELIEALKELAKEGKEAKSEKPSLLEQGKSAIQSILPITKTTPTEQKPVNPPPKPMGTQSVNIMNVDALAQALARAMVK